MEFQGQQDLTMPRFFGVMSCLGAILILALAIGALVVMGMLLFPAEDDQVDPVDRVVVFLFAAGLFVFLVWILAISTIDLKRRIRFGVSVDPDGIWPTHLGKEEGLVPWSCIRSVRERQFLQRLEVFDEDGELLLEIEYQLMGFTALRSFIAHQILENGFELTLPIACSKPWWYHALWLVGITSIPVAALYVAGMIVYPVIAYVVALICLVLAVRWYLASVYKVVFADGQLWVYRPRTTKSIPYSAIKHVELTDTFHSGRWPVVAVFVGEKEFVTFERLGVDATTLYIQLYAAGQAHLGCLERTPVTQ